MVYDISERIIGAPDAGSVAATISDTACRFLGCDSVTVLLLNPETAHLEIAASHGVPFHSRTSLDIGHGLMASVMASGKGEIVNDVAADERPAETDSTLNSLICSPLRAGGRSLGVVVAGSATARDFNAGDLQLLNAMSSQAATAVEVARLGDELGNLSSRPATLIYGVDDKPPIGVSVLLAIQHVFIALMSLAYPVLVTLEADGSRLDAASVVSMSLFAMAFATALQVIRAGPLGGGYLLPHITSAIYLGPSLLAARLGGLGLVFGMTVLAGFVGLVLAPLLRRFRKLFPPEISGVVVLMVGLSMVPVGVTRLIGLNGADTVSEPAEWAVGLVTLGTIIVLTVAPLGRVRLYSAAIGIALGYATAFLLDVVDLHQFQPLAALPMVGLHALPDVKLTLSFALLIPFVAAALASSVKSAGLIISVQKTNDARWKRADTRSVSGGVAASGLGNVMSGTLGGVGLDISAGSIGLSSATGATARVLGYFIAGVLCMLAFMPQVTAAVALMPIPVMGAGLVYVACHLITSGTELIASRMLDSRRTYVIGLSLVAGVGSLAIPDLLQSAPDWAAATLGNPLALCTLVAITLNVFMNMGISNRATLAFTADGALRERIASFVERQGASWGARVDVVRRTTPAVIEWCEEFAHAGGTGELALDLQFDEFRLAATVRASPSEHSASGDRQKHLLDAARRIAGRYECTFELLGDTGAQFVFEH
jgi:NCS2 family nucleobase:cation symporter-2